MSSTFFGLTIGASGLNTSQAQINTTANNISNVETKGYSKQVVNTVASSALRCYQNYGTTGTGVEAVSVTQCRDLYYDEKYWNNESNLGYYEKKLYYMQQIEGYYSETTSATGFSTIYSKMFNAMSTLQTNPGDNTVRKEFISDAKELTEYFNTTASRLSSLQSSINDEIKTAVDEINAIAEKVSILNKQINVIEQGGGHANELRDRRALLVDELSEYVSVDVDEFDVKNSNYPDMQTGATYFRLSINGQVLVDNYEFETLACKARDTDERYNQADVDGLYDIVWAEDGNKFDPCTTTSSGSLKSMFEVRDGNNAENLTGRVSATTSTSITITGNSIKEINELNLASSGAIWVNSTEYKYDSFKFVTDTNGTITSIEFTLDEDNYLTANEQGELDGKKLMVGSDVDFMGIPYYQNQMNLFLRNFCEKFNQIQHGGEGNARGVDANGNPMGAFFVANDTTGTEEHQMDTKYKNDSPTELSSDSEIYYWLTAANVDIAYKSEKDASIFAVTTLGNYTAGQDASDLVVELQKLQSKETIFRGGGGDAFLQCIYADVTVDTQECEIFTTNFTNIQTTIDQQRQSVSGVDEDEEALDLIKFQNAYNLASKCISVFNEIYDRLILQTGV